MAIELTPGRRAEIVAVLAEPGMTVTRAARKFRMKVSVIRGVRAEIEGSSAAVARPLRVVTADELAHKLENFADRAAEALLALDLTTETPVQVATAMGIAIDKGRLLRGQATQIVSSEVRVSLDAAIPLLVAEARRRGLAAPVVEGEFSEVRDGPS